MDTLECIQTRRSIRKFKNKKVTDDMIKKILQAGMMAPSAGNQQSWQFIVITEKKLLDEIPRIHPYAAMARQAAIAILICGDLNAETHKGFWVQDCSAAAQNMLLAAHALGLGAVWTAVYPRQDRIDAARELFGLPQYIVPLALIPIGYSDEVPKTENRFAPEKVHVNRW